MAEFLENLKLRPFSLSRRREGEGAEGKSPPAARATVLARGTALIHGQLPLSQNSMRASEVFVAYG
jgi:hypothetical protein